MKNKELLTKLQDAKEKMELAKDSCCFSSIEIEWDEWGEVIHSMEEVISELKARFQADSES